MAIIDVVEAVIRSQHPSDQRLAHEGDGSSTRSISGQEKRSSVELEPPRPRDHSTNADASLPFPITPLKSPGTTPRLSLPDTPSTRTGPPRSLSFNYSLPSSPVVPPSARTMGKPENGDIMENDVAEGDGFPFQMHPSHSTFRGALEISTPEKDPLDRKGKGREKSFDDSWNPMRWFHESPLQEKPEPICEEAGEVDDEKSPEKARRKQVSRHQTMDTGKKANGAADLQRSQSHPPPRAMKRSAGSAKWGRLRSLLPAVIRQSPSGHDTVTHSVVTSHDVNITDELITGGLSTLMLRLWFERDEKGRRRIPALFHRLRIRISDSLHPLHASKAVFRIECEYANGAARWVVYRQLRDFFSLHAHYTLSNAFNDNVEALPEFPRTSLPYFKFLRKESSGAHVRQADFARMQREALEEYLLKLIRAVMFHPASNRLAGFLEVSALFVALAQSGGAQYKAGSLRIEASGSGAGLGRKSARWRERKESRWCAVRESYLVIMEDPGELAVWDVFLLDSDFKIVRPTRYYRKGLHLLRPEPSEREFISPRGVNETEFHPETEADCVSAIGSLRGKLSRALHIGHRSTPNVANVQQALHRRLDSASSGSSVSSASRPPTPMLDPSTNANPLDRTEHGGEGEGEGHDNESETERRKKKKRSHEVSKHTFYIENSQMRLKLFAKNERQMLQWITALEKVAATSHYTGNNRFDSFAPIRLNVAAQWLVDGRDYMWNLSRAILLARETIYIHDWWLSPELQMRRPNKEKYRLDKLLERKAKEGVKIHIILYQEVSSRTTPTDSNYTKQRLTSLHENIMVQRSPSHFQTGTFYWAHHEKLCVIDQTIAFMGGIDLCFGRWDTPQHVIVDDPEISSEQTEIWPGKDYSNPRILDFHTLNKPDEDMYDRTKVPRMPWHDVGMQVVGQPARDLARHFVERWNYLLRIKNHSRVMPFLIPPPEFKPGELAAMGLTGTCEMQICRSAGPWSLGTPGRIEHSIQNAYLKAIELSEHFVYIENQFFITSTVVNDVKVENQIGDALVHRIIRAHREGTPWKCCIVIPLFPGFPFPVDHSDASAIRIILECQNRTISRGPHSIFSRLRKEGIDPDNYISVFSLRNWAKMRGDILTTEIVYIHGKVCIVDDRLAIIGSANINERSQRGDRDSEIAAVIRDTDMIEGTMAGRPFQVGRFAHTLRMRLMREHVGVDVDALSEEEYIAGPEITPEHQQEAWDPDTEQEYGRDKDVTQAKHETPIRNLLGVAGEGIKQSAHAAGDAAVMSASRTFRKPLTELEFHQPDTPDQDASIQEERMTYSREGKKEPGFASAMVPTLEEKTIAEHLPAEAQANGAPIGDKLQNREEGRGSPDDPSEAHTADGEAFGAPAHASKNPEIDDEPPHAESGVNDADEEERAAPATRSILRKHLAGNLGNKTWTLPTPAPNVDPHGFEDPVSDAFWKSVWVACAVHNTEIYRKVFHAIPDDLVTTWKQYKEFVMHHERFAKPAKDSHSPDPVARVPSETAYNDGPYQKGGVADKAEQSKEYFDGSSGGSSTNPHTAAQEKETRSRKGPRGSEPFDKKDKEEMEQLLKDLRGHLVVHPLRFLEGEDIAENFLFNADRMMPLPIYD
ncbi:phospholipase D [Leucogyrophana mollusca]|uniref:Phospholipase D n=1 Tax=Leucogyrophana mollusca TaxID=85980 RepID=A0ACB8B894_9AGAM|nr:phospholipase D [Leucogyrophana mollusca]